jgi:hypothetical protein
MAEDFVAHEKRQQHWPGLVQQPRHLEMALRDIQRLLTGGHKTLAEFGLPEPPPDEAAHSKFGPRLSAAMAEQLCAFNRDDEAASAQRMQNQLNHEQRAVYDAVLNALHHPSADQKTSFFVYSPGGCGKTFLFEALLAATRGEGSIALAVATSGIASLLLPGGTTAHYRFKLPLDTKEDHASFMSLQSDAAQVLKHASLIIWDEAPMAHRRNFKAVNTLLQDIMQRRDLPFGGKIFVMGGDFRQVR